MSGHNKWSQIKHKKEITDAKKSKIFSKLVKNITVQARLANGKESVPLMRAIEKAKKANMPSSNIEKAIKKAKEENVNMENIIYEAYGPMGTQLIIDTLTNNKNRTSQEIKHILNKNSANLASIGSVIWAFEKESSSTGLVYKAKNLISIDEENLEKLNKLIDELEDNDDVQEIFTNLK